MGSPDCPISLRTALVAFDRGLRRSKLVQSMGPTVNAVRNTIVDIQSHLTEKKGSAYFANIFEEKVNSVTGKSELFWPQYDRSITKSLLRNAALKRRDKAPAAERALAEFELDMWQYTIEPAILNLREGKAVQYLAFKSENPQDGASFQQISRRNGQLVLESQLLSLDQVNQLQALMEVFNDQGENVSIKSENSEVDPMVGWIVKGPAIDFQEDLPGFIDQAMNQFRQDFLPMESTSFQPPEMVLIGGRSEIQLTEPDLKQTKQLDRQDRVIPSAEATGFWFKLVAAAAVPTRLDFEGIAVLEAPILETTPNKKFLAPKVPVEPQIVDLGEAKPVMVTVFETPIVKQEVINLDKSKPKEKPELSRRPTRSLLAGKLIEIEKQQLKVTVVEDRCCFPKKRILEKAGTAAIVFESTRMFLEDHKDQEEAGLVEDTEPVQFKPEPVKQHPADTAGNNRDRFSEVALIEMPAGTVPAGQEKEPVEKESDTLSNDQTKKGERLIITSVTAKQPSAMKIETVSKQELEKQEMVEIPIYQTHWQPAAIKDIPEWVWQGTAAIPDEIIDWPWFLVTMFYALLNTKVLLKERVNENFSLNQGSGFSFLEEKTN